MEPPAPPVVPQLFLVVGERSGDRHGAGLIQALQEREGQPLQFAGLGGPQMKALAPEIEDWVEDAAVVGIVEVLKKYGYFKKRFDATLARILATRPAAVVLIDYPGFNLRLAKALRNAHFSGKIIYYISPQVWAWHRGRIPQMAQFLDLMLCIFPFEKDLYEGYGLKTQFTGHPLVAWHRQQDRGLQRQENLVGLFPGSRSREIAKVFPAMLQAAQRLHQQSPELRFVASAASAKLAARMKELLAQHPGLPVSIQEGNVYDLMRTCTAGAVASGTATLEAAILQLPFVLVYKVAWPTYFIGKRLIKVPHLGMVNILAGKELIPELIQGDCTGEKIAQQLTLFLKNPTSRENQLRAAQQVIAQLGQHDAYAQAASAVMGQLS